MENVVIIGSGPAAWTAAIYAARASLLPLVIEGEYSQENQEKGILPMGQLATTTEIENFPGFPPGDLSGFIQSAIPDDRRVLLIPRTSEPSAITGPELVELIRTQAITFGTRVISTDVVDVDFSCAPFKVIVATGTICETKTIIVATGASAQYLGLPSEKAFKNRGVSACAVCDGALPRFRNKPIAVVGGGDTAVEEAEYLAKFASKVYIVHRRNELRASKIMTARAETNPKIEILWNRAVAEILGDDPAAEDSQGVTGIRLDSTVGEEPLTLEVSGVFLAIGHRPNVDFLHGKLALTEKGYIAKPNGVDTTTSVPGVFAAGDVADEHYRQAITAAASGCMAALDAERFLSQHPNS